MVSESEPCLLRYILPDHRFYLRILSAEGGSQTEIRKPAILLLVTNSLQVTSASSAYSLTGKGLSLLRKFLSHFYTVCNGLLLIVGALVVDVVVESFRFGRAFVRARLLPSFALILPSWWTGCKQACYLPRPVMQC